MIADKFLNDHNTDADTVSDIRSICPYRETDNHHDHTMIPRTHEKE